MPDDRPSGKARKFPMCFRFSWLFFLILNLCGGQNKSLGATGHWLVAFWVQLGMKKRQKKLEGMHPGKFTWNPKMEVQIINIYTYIFLFKQVMFRFQPLIFRGVHPDSNSSNCSEEMYCFFIPESKGKLMKHGCVLLEVKRSNQTFLGEETQCDINWFIPIAKYCQRKKIHTLHIV